MRCKRDSFQELNSLVQRVQSVSMMLTGYDRELQDVDVDGDNPLLVNARACIREAINKTNEAARVLVELSQSVKVGNSQPRKEGGRV